MDPNGQEPSNSASAPHAPANGQGDESLRRLNRELRAVSNCNQLLMRATDEQALLENVCRIVREEAGYRLVWVGYLENGGSRTIRLVAWAGDESGSIAKTALAWADLERGRGPSGVALLNEGMGCLQGAADSPFARWLETAMQRGFRSSLVLPLKDEAAQTFGILNIYSEDADAFTEEERRLLQELAGDLAFGITVLRARIERRRTEDILQARLRLLECAVAHSMDEFLTAALDEMEALTGSQVGFYHFVEADQLTLSLQSWSTNTLKHMCQAEGKGSHYPIDQAGVWADCVHERRPVIHNDYASLPHRKGLPEHHAPIFREVVVPIFRGDQIKAIIGVGNKPANYEACDIEVLSHLGDLSWDIAERLRAEQEVRESEAKLAAAFNASPSLVAITRREDGRILEVNPGFTRMLGYSRAEAIGRTTSELSIWADPGDRNAFLAGLQSSGQVMDLEVQLRHKDGALITVLDSARTIQVQGETCVLSVARDITERKKSEAALYRMNRELRAISNCNQTLMRATEEQALLDEICRIVHAEAGYRLAWVGYAEDDEAKTVRPVAWAGAEAGYIAQARLTWADTERGRGPTGTCIRTGKTVFVQDLKTSPTFSPWLASALRSGFRSSISLPLINETAQAFGALMIYSEEVDAFTPAEVRLLEELAGDLAFGITVLRTRLQRRQAEEALRESEQKFRALAENSPDNIFRYDAACRVLYANQQVRSTLSVLGRAFFGKTPLEITPGGLYEGGLAELEHYQDTLRSVIASGGMAEVEMHVADPSGGMRTHIVRFRAERDVDGKIVGALAFGRDITDKKKLMEQLGQSQKMEAIGQLAGGVAHDFNNILTAIMGFGNLAKMQMGPDHPQQPLIDQILTSADRAAHLTQSLLTFSRKQVFLPKPVDLNVIVKSVEKLLNRLIGEDIELVTRLDDPSLIVMADAGQIEQILMNLATNARDAMPKGGRLTITAESRSLGSDFTNLYGLGKPGAYALVTVADTGVGMDEATRRKIFEPFFTTKEAGKGTGLGLSMVYGIVHQHEGFINVYSERGKGTTFRIYLPIAAVAAEEARPEKTAPPRGGTETILLAEDDQVVRSMTSGVLQDFGYRVIEAVDGADALDKFKQHGKEIDLMLLDVIMPKMSGKDLYDTVKGLGGGAKTLFVSGYTADFIHRKGLFEEGVHFVAKPVSPFDLLKKVRDILDGSS